MLHILPTIHHLLAASKSYTKKIITYLLTGKIKKNSGVKKVRRIGHYQKKVKTGRATKQGGRTREVVGKWNQITAQRFRTRSWEGG